MRFVNGDPSARTARPRERRIEVGGYATRALELEGDGPPIVLLHGFSDSADCWRPLLAILAREGRRAVAVDLPGFAAADPLEDDLPVLPQLDRAASDLIRSEAARAGREVIVAGNSLGGCIALRAAERTLPIESIAPIAPAGLEMARWFPIIEGERLIRIVTRSRAPIPQLVLRDVIGRAYRALAFAAPGSADPGAVASFTRHMPDVATVQRYLNTGRRMLPELRDPFRLDRIRCPVLLVWGDCDRLVFTNGAERVLRAVAHSRLEVIERCGHCPQVEHPERLAALIGELASSDVPAVVQ